MRRKSYTELVNKIIPLRSIESKADIVSRQETPSSPKQSDDEKGNLSKARKQIRRMSTGELELLASSEDDFVFDCILNRVPMIKELECQKDNLSKQVSSLASFNYAREPDFVRDRLRLRNLLDEVSSLKRRVTTKRLLPILEELNKAQSKLSTEARNSEEQSERMAQEFLDGGKTHDQFIEEYLKLRKETSKKRILADKLTKERNDLLEKISASPRGSDSPLPNPRQRKRLSFNRC